MLIASVNTSCHLYADRKFKKQKFGFFEQNLPQSFSNDNPASI